MDSSLCGMASPRFHEIMISAVPCKVIHPPSLDSPHSLFQCSRAFLHLVFSFSSRVWRTSQNCGCVFPLHPVFQQKLKIVHVKLHALLGTDEVSVYYGRWSIPIHVAVEVPWMHHRLFKTTTFCFCWCFLFCLGLGYSSISLITVCKS